jgi:aminopeptidase N
MEDDAIEAEQVRDATATGKRQAAVARAARPTPVAKDLAWADVFNRTDLPNAIIEATIGGFMQPEQIELLEPYRERFFADLPRVWADRTMETASSITMGLYPAYLIDDDTIAATDAFLDTDNTATKSPAGRRLLLESRDGVQRAMRARAKDASA